MNVTSEAFAFTLSRIRWELFGTLTFRGSVPAPRVGYGLCWREFHQVAEVSERLYSSLLIALRQDEGEKFGRGHFHWLLGGTRVRNLITLSNQIEYDWKCLTGAKAEVRRYDCTLAGAEYVASRLTGANEYEVGKFDLAASTTLSSSVFAVIRNNERIGAEVRQALVKKRASEELVVARC